MARPWEDMTAEFELRDARMVATLTYGGGAIVETGLHLIISEGRSLLWGGRGDATLEYRVEFEAAGKPPPEASEAAEGMIVIEGTHSNGLRLEIRGQGFVGYDDRGTIEGSFYDPPSMLVDDPGDEAEAEGEPEISEEAFGKLMNNKPKLSQQYRKAVVGRRFPADAEQDV